MDKTEFTVHKLSMKPVQTIYFLANKIQHRTLKTIKHVAIDVYIELNHAMELALTTSLDVVEPIVWKIQHITYKIIENGESMSL